jgi:hypothetical protein
MDEIDRLIGEGVQGLKASIAQTVRRHIFSNLMCMGKHTVTGQIATAARQFQDWTADYRLYSNSRFNPEDLFAPIRKRLIKKHNPCVVALDDTRVKKTGPHIPGVKYHRDPMGPPFHLNFIRAQRFLQLSMAMPGKNGQARMVPVDFVHAPTPAKPPKKAGPEVWEQYLQARKQYHLPNLATQRVKHLRNNLDADGRKDLPLWIVADGSFTNRRVLKPLPQRTTLIGRIRADAKLYHLPSQQLPKGRRRVYGEIAPTPEQLLKDPNVPWRKVRVFAAGQYHEFRIKTLAPLRWRAAGEKHSLRLIVIAPLGYRLRKNSKILYRNPSLLICTDIQASLEKIIQAYVWRWDIEVNFRDQKTTLGLGQQQVRHPNSVESAPALLVAAYAMLLVASENNLPENQELGPLPPPKWRRKTPLRPSTQTLINHLRHEAWGHTFHFSDFKDQDHQNTKSQKCPADLKSALFYGAQRT